MLKMLLFITGFISLIIGSIIFLIGIGAIFGIAVGLLSIVMGSFISVAGAIAIICFAFGDNPHISSKKNQIIDLMEKNGSWVSSEV